MLIKKPGDIRYSEVPPKALYFDRRRFLAAMPAAFLGARELLSPSARARAAGKFPNLAKSPFSTTEKENSLTDVSHYNNFYEFGTAKDEPSRLAKNFKTYPWTVSVEGEVAKPRKFSIDEILKLAPLEERIYRHRCVEAWSIVVPWAGYSLSVLLNLVQPTSKARFVAFQSYYSPGEMPEAQHAGIDFPYVEGLRLVEKMPPNTWNTMQPIEYGFYSNVNPNVDHPRWSQASERRLGELRRRPTLMFNGYGDQVASLYTGMDLKKNF